MKIISKYKDFYDYLQGIYGIDEKLVLDRRENNGSPPTSLDHKEVDVINLCIAGKIIQFVRTKNEIYFGEDLKQFHQDTYLNKTIEKIVKYTIPTRYEIKKRKEVPCYFEHIYYPYLSEDIHNIFPQLKNINCPIFLFYIDYAGTFQTYNEFCKLENYNINKAISAQEIWILLSTWLGNKVTENEPIVPVGDDKIRIQAAGFDLKTSFRH